MQVLPNSYLIIIILLFIHITLAGRCCLCEPHHACLLSIFLPGSVLALLVSVHSSAQYFRIILWF